MSRSQNFNYYSISLYLYVCPYLYQKLLFKIFSYTPYIVDKVCISKSVTKLVYRALRVIVTRLRRQLLLLKKFQQKRLYIQ